MAFIPLVVFFFLENKKSIIFFLVLKIVLGFVCRMIVSAKGYPRYMNHGFAWGFWLSALGLLICLLKKRYKRPARRRTAPPKTSGVRQPAYSTPRPKSSQNPVSTARQVTPQNFRTKLDTLYDKEDKRNVALEEHREYVKKTRQVEETVKKRYRPIGGQQEIVLDMAWSNNLYDLLEATEIVYTNAQMNCNSTLVRERFSYYINLHYRSFTAADLCHAKLQEIYKARNNINGLLTNLTDKSNPLRVSEADFQQLVRARNSLNDLCRFLENRRDSLNVQTGTIRDKIRDECGSKGKQWYDSLMERAGK